MAIPYASGKNASLRVFLDNSGLIMKVKSWDITREGTMAEDGVNGEDRNRNQFITTGYGINVEIFVEDGKNIRSFLDIQDNEDASTAPLDAGIGLVLKPNNGTRESYTLSEVTFGAWSWSSTGMTDRQMIKVPFKARYLDKAAAL